ncbi:hypothetical protein MKW94_029275 [Papaver nudicaule]|uniref:Protein kinase domain-containing protein n=1 Tax=Papaver nudicaule TaxID=74823 RepID=A0AA41VRQ4_PAPNU|nr:hypothetical protein [Papaver nudicaule]
MRKMGLFQIFCVIFGVVCLSWGGDCFSSDEILALKAFKEAVYEDPLLVLSNWNFLNGDPCDWSGINCSIAHDHVISLTVDILVNQTAILCKEIPDIDLVTQLVHTVGNLPRIIYLKGIPFVYCCFRYASRGNATGFCRSTQLKSLDFSYNFFVGKIPQCLAHLPGSSFQGNCFQDKNYKQRHASQCGASQPAGSHQPANVGHQHAKGESKHKRKSQPAWLLALEIITGILAAVILLFAVLAAVRKCNGKYHFGTPWKKVRSGNESMFMYIESDMLKDVTRLSKQELEVACEDFSNIIGSSPDTLIYKGNMKDGSEVAVISLCAKEDLWTCYLEVYFQREVADLARLNHENTGKLFGYCRESNPFSRMLVFEYASNGTLYEYLHFGEGCQLSWRRRINIIVGIARGLRYLHTELEPPFAMSELNSSAVYLTEDFSPKLVDFEIWNSILARLEKKSGFSGSEVALCGFTESLEIFRQDVHDNIYAFGVLLLEIISGRPTYCKNRGHLVDWAKEYLELPEVMSYLADPELRHFKYDDLKVICEVVNLCIQSEPSKRPSMQLLCPMLENLIEASITSDLSDSSLAWAELAISS